MMKQMKGSIGESLEVLFNGVVFACEWQL
jgi:hypothetical protein